MPFDPAKPFEVVEESAQAGFDPNQPFEVVGDPRQLKPSTVQTIAERESFGQQIRQDAARPSLEKAISGALGIGKALASPVVATVKAIPGALELAGQPERIPATVLEGARRAGMDLSTFIADAVKNAPKSALLGPLTPAAAIYEALKPKTLTEADIQKAFEALPMQEALQRERTTIPESQPLGKPQPEVSEAIGQDLPLLIPVKGIKGLRGPPVTSDIGRSIRAAIKPPNAQLGSRVESAAKSEMGDIFNLNKNADKIAATPFEGFLQSVGTLRKQVGEQISTLHKSVGETFSAGDDVANILDKKAASLERAGEPAASVQFIKDRANDFRGKLTEIDDLQEAVTLANQRRSPFFAKARAAQDPMRANVEGIVDNIIAEEGGSSINKALETVGGAEGSALRKKWANLMAIEKQASERLNKLINNAPPEVQSAASGILNSLQGMGGLLGLIQGYASGALPLANAALRSFAKRAEKQLKDSNSLIQKTYENLRKNPPAATPPPIAGLVSQSIEAPPQAPTLQELITQSLQRQPPQNP